MNCSLSSSIQACRQLTKQANSNFVPAFALLPPQKRQAMEILYAFNRYTDDIADSAEHQTCRLQKLDQWASNLDAALNGKQYSNDGGTVYLPALIMIVDQYSIPREPLFQLIDGMKTDIVPKPFATFDDCLIYCDQVAVSAGIASLAIWGTAEPLASEAVRNAARACGIAFQWTNIIRDLREDYENGRIYLPQSEMKHFGMTDEQFGTMLLGLPDERLGNLLAFQLDRCRSYYEQSLPLYELIHPDSRRTFGLMRDYYYTLYCKIANNPLSVTQRDRIRLSFWQKVRLWLRWRFSAGKISGKI